MGCKAGLTTHKVFLDRKSTGPTPVRMVSEKHCECGWSKTVNTWTTPARLTQKKTDARLLLIQEFDLHMGIPPRTGAWAAPPGTHVPNSNHLSGSAVDINAALSPFQKAAQELAKTMSTFPHMTTKRGGIRFGDTL